MIEHSNLEEYQDPVNYDLEFDGEMDKYQFFRNARICAVEGGRVDCYFYGRRCPYLRIRQATYLQPHGIFAFETRNPEGTDLSDQEETEWGSFIDKDGNNVKVSGTQCYNASQHIMHWVTMRDWGDKRTTSRIACRFTDQDTLHSLLTRHGFHVEHQYTEWDKTSFSPSSIISLCRKCC